MKEDSKTLHATYRDKNRHWHFFMLLVPSMIFVLVLALFIRNRDQSTLGIETSLQAQTPAPAPTHTVRINETEIKVRLAETQAEQRQGLSGVSSLGENEGMLFVFPGKTRTAFWMKDMLIPLDMIWIADSKIIQIDKSVPVPEPDTPDDKLKLIVPSQEIDRVLEVNAGFAESHSIKVGDSVVE